MAPHDAPDDEAPLPLPGPSIGPVRRRTYSDNPKHGPFGRGSVSRKPRDGQDALDWSVPVQASSEVRMGIDYEEGVMVVLRYHDGGEFRERPWDERFHGYVVPWSGLTQRMKNALIKAGLSDRRGRIL